MKKKEKNVKTKFNKKTDEGWNIYHADELKLD